MTAGGTTAMVTVGGRARGLPATTVQRVVRRVLRGEGAAAAVSVTFAGPRRMRRLNGHYLGADRPTDVIAFALPQLDGSVLGDVYVCPAVAARQARANGVSLRQELIRLVIHGTLHVLGWDHPGGAERSASAMWRRQERYVRQLA
jgi:probable rRNA maturation factor